MMFRDGSVCVQDIFGVSGSLHMTYSQWKNSRVISQIEDGH